MFAFEKSADQYRRTFFLQYPVDKYLSISWIRRYIHIANFGLGLLQRYRTFCARICLEFLACAGVVFFLALHNHLSLVVTFCLTHTTQLAVNPYLGIFSYGKDQMLITDVQFGRPSYSLTIFDIDFFLVWLTTLLGNPQCMFATNHFLYCLGGCPHFFTIQIDCSPNSLGSLYNQSAIPGPKVNRNIHTAALHNNNALLDMIVI